MLVREALGFYTLKCQLQSWHVLTLYAGRGHGHGIYHGWVVSTKSGRGIIRSLWYLPDMRVFNVQGGTKPHGVFGGVVGEDDGPHRGLARSGLAHEQHLLLHDE